MFTVNLEMFASVKLNLNGLLFAHHSESVFVIGCHLFFTSPFTHEY